jgi:hypothetical protein
MSYLCSLWLFPRCSTHCSVFVFLFCLSSSSVPHICCQFFVVHFWLPLRYSSFIHSLVLETKWDTRAWHSSDTWHPCSSLPREGEFYLILYFVFSDRGKNIFILSRTINRACCESLISKWFRVCLSFFDLRILITPLVSSNSSSENNNYTSSSILNLLCSVVGHAEFPIRQSNDYSYTVWIHSSLYILIKII